MQINRSISRVLAAAVASTGFAVPVPAFAASLACTSSSFQAVADGNGNINVTCTTPGTTQPPPSGPTAPPPPPPPTTPGGVISCPGFDKTIVLDLNWGAPGTAAPRLATSGFGGNTITVARFTTPATSAPNVYAQIKSGQWVDAAREVTAALSTSPCDFSYPNPLGRLATTTQPVVSPAVTYAVGGSSLYYAILQPGTTYYFNIKHQVNGVPTCASGSCNMFVELQKPNGL